ncbi:jg18905 [Pararge aegeria aegeria]|uniref:Jg18905 protein n=1 Tax=Pararge aegeria aegeria TaxID=348720 RepID=A0A8S4QSL4_9NEOP|nr:jg18905 [Pararge aegeria aegeria]
MFTKVFGDHQSALGQRGGLRSLPLLIEGGDPCSEVAWLSMSVCGVNGSVRTDKTYTFSPSNRIIFLIGAARPARDGDATLPIKDAETQRRRHSVDTEALNLAYTSKWKPGRRR